MSAPDNKTLMQAAVDRWIAEAKTHPNGAELLQAKAIQMNEDMGTLEFRLGADVALDKLEGLTAWDLADAREALNAEALKLRARVRETV